uniref:Vestigial like family member 3 n=1 Tax=Scophthalmus maximus TaxID=52904 RepID=A0A8D3A626_SCOMX
MSCLDVMYHQSYGAHYLPTAAYKATYYNHHHQQQQRKLSVYSKMQECMEQQQQQQQQGAGRGMLPPDQGLRHGPGCESGGRRSTSNSELKDGAQPAEAKYLSSRCVLFTYYQGDIGDVIDEHFSRALSQSSAFNSETKPIRVTQQSASPTAGLWKDGGGSLSEGQSSSVWNSTTYPSQTSPCLPPVSVSVHPDFSPSPVSFNHPDGALWAGHVLSQASLPPPAALPESWTYSLNTQGTSGYPNVHDVYHTHPHAHIHSRHHHPMLHSYPAHSPALDPRFNPLLLPGVRNQNQPAANPGSSPHSEGVKTEMDPSSISPVTATSVTWAPSVLHGSLEAYDSALDQTKAKTSVWF